MLTLIYIFDSLRRDFLGCYGDAGAVTPHLDRFAAGATRFTQAYAAAAWSKASGAALLTGELPRAVHMRPLLARLPDGVPTLAERLRDAGAATVAVSANPFISHDFGLLRGFQTSIEAFRPGTLPSERFLFHANHFRRLAELLSVEPEALVLARAPALHNALLEALPATGPALALCWGMDTHAPFFVRGEQSLFGNPLERVIPAADAEWLTGGLTVRDVVALYRDMVAYADAHFGALVAALQARGQWEEVLVIVAADHGEAFGEHGLMGHSNGLWEEQITVPLLVKFPGQRTGATCALPVSLVQVAATMLEAGGIGGEGLGEASSLQQALAGVNVGDLLLENPEGWGLRSGDWKLHAATDEAAPLLFNLQTDPAERSPLGDGGLRHGLLARASALRVVADARATRWESAAESVADDAILARLRGLGYL